jgi:hypothetical protein
VSDGSRTDFFGIYPASTHFLNCSKKVWVWQFELGSLGVAAGSVQIKRGSWSESTGACQFLEPKT